MLGDVAASLFDRGLGQVGVVFPVAIRHVRVGRRRGGVGQAGGADDAGGQAGAVGQFQPGERGLAEAVGTVVAASGADADRAHVGFHAGGDGGHGAGRIRRLRIGVVGLAEGGVREALPAQQVLLARTALALAVEDARGGDGGQAHAVAKEQDDVLRASVHGAVGGGAGGAVAIPPGRRLAAGMGDDRDIDAGCRRRGGGGRGRRGAAGEQGGEGHAQDGQDGGTTHQGLQARQRGIMAR